MERLSRVIGKAAVVGQQKAPGKVGDRGWTKMHLWIPGAWRWVENVRRAEADPDHVEVGEVLHVATKADVKAVLEVGRRVVHVIVIAIVAAEEMTREVPAVIVVVIAKKIRDPEEEKTKDIVV